jgi:hypothetical protein
MTNSVTMTNKGQWHSQVWVERLHLHRLPPHECHTHVDTKAGHFANKNSNFANKRCMRTQACKSPVVAQADVTLRGRSNKAERSTTSP